MTLGEPKVRKWSPWVSKTAANGTKREPKERQREPKGEGFIWRIRGRSEPRTFQSSNIDHNDPSKPSHRSTNGPEPSKTIESDGRKIKKPSKNHWWQWSDRQKTFNGDGLLKNHWKFTMVSSKPLKLTMVSLKPLNLSMVLSNQYSLKRMELSCGHNYNLELALL